MSQHVFLSYATPDKPVADAICSRLEAAGIRCWIAPRDILPGTEWAEAISAALHESQAFVLVFSAHANASAQVRRETERAVHHEVPVLPFRIEDTLPTRGLEYLISLPHWLDAMSPPLEAHIGRLLETLRRLLDEREAHDATRPPPVSRGRGPRRALLAVCLAVALGAVALRSRSGGSDAPVLASEVLEAANTQDYRFARDRAELDELWRGRFARYEARASEGDANAMACLHYARERALGCDADPGEAYAWALRAERTGAAIGTYLLGRALELGIGTERSPAAATPLLEQAAAGGVGFAKVWLASRTLRDEAAGTGALERARVDLEECIEAGVGYARVVYADAVLARRLAVEDPVATALAVLRTGAERGYAPAQFALGISCAEGSNGVERDFAVALEWLSRAADQGLPAAQSALARALVDEEPFALDLGLAPDPRRARELLEAAAEQGHAGAHCVLAFLLERGLGGPRSTTLALEHCREAEARGEPYALALRGTWHLQGTVLEQDDEQAVALFKDAIRSGVPGALFWFAYCLEEARGFGVDMPRSEALESFRPHAIYWYLQAAHHGDGRAVERLVALRPEVEEKSTQDWLAVWWRDQSHGALEVEPTAAWRDLAAGLDAADR